MPKHATLANENTALKRQLATVRDERVQLEERQRLLEAAIANRDVLIHALQEQLALLKHQRFGSSSEVTPPEQARLFDEAELHAEAPAPDVEKDDVAACRRRGRPRLPIGLPRTEVHHEIPEAERICPHDGTTLVEIGQERSEQLEFIPASVRVIEHVRHKYACPCCESHVATAAKPPQMIPKSIATPSLLAQVTTSKYADGLPLYRLAVILARIGIDLDRTTLANWMVSVGLQVQVLIDLLWQQMRAAPVLHMDETSVQVLQEPGRSARADSYMWVTATGPPERSTVLFHYAPSRSGDVPKQLLSGYSGALMTDGYPGYDGLTGVTRLACMAHARRKFIEAQRLQVKGIPGKADYPLKLINALYRIEREAADLTLEERHAARQDKSKPLLETLHAWLVAEKPAVPPQTTLGKAMSYLRKQWPLLIRYVDNPAYPIDNNRVENAIRPFVIGRKGWLFSTSVNGAKASANLYSLVETAKGHGLNPFDYLMHVFEELPKAKAEDDYLALLPAAYAARIAQAQA